MSRVACLGVLGTALLIVAQAPQAHHSVAAEFDTSLRGELSGEITQVWYRNPHIRYRLTIENEDGSAEDWELQGGNVTNLRRAGWYEDSLRVGDAVTVSGDFGRNGAKKLRIREIRNAAGLLYPPAPAEPRTPRNVVNASPERDYGFGDGEPRPIDITGPWRNSYQWRVTVDDLEPKPTPFTAEGRRLFEATEPWHDPALRCTAMGLPRIFGSPYNMTIVDAGSHYLFVYVEHNVPRRVWTDGREAPPSHPPTSMGFSTGRWEGDVLVVETTHLSPGWLDGSGLPMSGEGTRIVERYVFSEDRLTVDRTMTIDDPYYTEPLVRQRYSARDDDVDFTEQAPCDPDSYYRDLSESGRLEEHFNR